MEGLLGDIASCNISSLLSRMLGRERGFWNMFGGGIIKSVPEECEMLALDFLEAHDCHPQI